MIWMRMPGQTWPAAAATFVGMWTLMMVPMMLPSVAPVLWRYGRATVTLGVRPAALRAGIAGVGYFVLWALVGLAVFPLGAAVAAATMAQPALAHLAPVAAGLTVVLAGLWQLTPWKAHHLAGGGRSPSMGCSVSPCTSVAWRDGLRLGVRCAGCCANLMFILLVTGIMDVHAMVVIGTAITAERIGVAGQRIARVTGVLFVASGVVLVARAVAW